jgi:segregation and condensation protein A
MNAVADPLVTDSAYQVRLDVFEGPLDLLLHLVRKHELDVFDIPISFITEKYLEYLDLMSSLNLDVAGEYLLMAATLAHIKSRQLLPSAPSGEPGELDDGNYVEGDPREELIRRLL